MSINWSEGKLTDAQNDRLAVLTGQLQMVDDAVLRVRVHGYETEHANLRCALKHELAVFAGAIYELYKHEDLDAHAVVEEAIQYMPE